MTKRAQLSQTSRNIGAGDVKRARALSDPTRVRLLDLLVTSKMPRTVSSLSVDLKLHQTVVRKHLKLLEQAGFVMAEPLPHSGRGRPSSGWTIVSSESNAYQLLSEMLAGALRSGTDSFSAGQAAGRRLATVGQHGVDVIMAEAAKLGFEPRKDVRSGGRVDIVLDNCPFASVAEREPEIVCTLHHGLASGIASVCGNVLVERLDLRPPRAAGCRLVLRVA